jgi:hypothetical protein
MNSAARETVAAQDSLRGIGRCAMRDQAPTGAWPGPDAGRGVLGVGCSGG